MCVAQTGNVSLSLCPLTVFSWLGPRVMTPHGPEKCSVVCPNCLRCPSSVCLRHIPELHVLFTPDQAGYRWLFPFFLYIFFSFKVLRNDSDPKRTPWDLIYKDYAVLAFVWRWNFILKIEVFHKRSKFGIKHDICFWLDLGRSFLKPHLMRKNPPVVASHAFSHSQQHFCQNEQ